MTLEQLLRDGVEPNPQQNTTMDQAWDLKRFLEPLFPVEGVIVNTVTSFPLNAAYILADGYDFPKDAKLYFHLRVDDGGREVYFGVANIQAVRRNQGDKQAAVLCLDKIVPDWRTKPEIADKVSALKAFVPPPAVTPDQPVAAMPNWTDPRKEGHLGVRVGDHSPDGTKYTAADGAVFEKGKWLSPFETTWKRL